MSWAPDFVKLAKAYGAEGLPASRTPAQVRPVLEQAFGNGKLTIVDVVVVSREENVYPMVPAGASLHEMLLGLEGARP
jgi:acetolactate synthase-1/2/3 large subunit